MPRPVDFSDSLRCEGAAGGSCGGVNVSVSGVGSGGAGFNSIVVDDVHHHIDGITPKAIAW